MNKIVIYVSGGMVQGVRSNISSELDIEIIDEDNEGSEASELWEEAQDQLPYENY
jgi:hypothetical protein